ncbi:MAG: hypothetical protein RID23_03850 [Roseovarius sp.]
MTKKDPDKARPAGKDSREDRLKAALKANMARRKAQVRGRKNAAGADEADKDEG